MLSTPELIAGALIPGPLAAAVPSHPGLTTGDTSVAGSLSALFALTTLLALAALAAQLGAVFGFGKKKQAERSAAQERKARARAELTSELEALRVELESLAAKLNVELSTGNSDRTTTLSRYPRRIVELKIRIDELERALAALDAR